MVSAPLLASTPNFAVPDDTALRIRLDDTLTSVDSEVGDPFSATVVDGGEYGNAGVYGHVAKIDMSGKIKGHTSMVLRFDGLVMWDGLRAPIHAEIVELYHAPSGEKVDVEGAIESGGRGRKTIGHAAIGAGAGALLGGIFGGGRGPGSGRSSAASAVWGPLHSTGLAGAAAAATLGQQGYHVHCFSYHDTPRRAHSIAAQGGINAAKNYRNDGDSVFRLFKDTVKGGDFRAREANVFRLAEVSVNIIDQCVAQGVPFAREYGGLLDNRSFGGVQVERTFYARGQTGQQLLLGAYQALEEQVAAGTVTMHIRSELLDVVIVSGRARGIVTRDLVTGQIECHAADVVVLATGGYSNVFYLSTNAKASNCTAIWRAHRRGALFGNPCFTQIHPTCIPLSSEHQSKLTLMSESLRNDGRVWVPKKKGETRPPSDIHESERDYYLETRYPSFGNLVPRDVASRNAKEVCDEGRGVGPHGQGVYLDFADAIHRLGMQTVREKYGNLFDIYQRITGEDAYRVPMRIYPAPHYTMGGLWVDYHLMSTVSGLFVGGEANFSDHGANRLGASALMQGLSDGYFILPATVPDYLASTKLDPVATSDPAFEEAKTEVKARIDKLLAIRGKRSPDSFHKELGRIVWDNCGMARSDAGLRKALARIPELREEFWNNLCVVGTGEELNQSLEKANRISDFLELAELMCIDASDRTESCGGHFRVESQTPDGEAKRDDANFSYTATWEWQGLGQAPTLRKEPLNFEYVPLSQRSYK